jgi:hypothetical protein
VRPWAAAIFAGLAGCSCAPVAGTDGGIDGGERDAPAREDVVASDVPVDAGPCGAFPDLLATGDEPWPCYETPWCASPRPLTAYTDVYGPIGDTVIPLSVATTTDGVRIEALTRFVAQPSGSGPIARAARTAYRVRILEGRPIATIESVTTIELSDFEAAWAEEVARVSATFEPGRPHPVVPSSCAVFDDVEVWLAPHDDLDTGVPSGTMIGATYAPATGEAWTIDLPMVPWACRAEPFVDCTFGFLGLLGAAVEYGRPFANFVLRPGDYCTVHGALCDFVSADPDPCLDASPRMTCDESAWVRSVCTTPSFELLAPADAPFCEPWSR